MKRFTTLIAAGAVAMALTAAFSSAASAGTVLCSQAENPCVQPNIRSAGTNFRVGNINTASFEVGNALSCTNNVLTAKSTMRNGNPLPAEFSGWVNPSSCTVPFAAQGTVKCSSVTMNSPSTTIKSTGGDTAVVEIGSAAQPLTISFSCISSVGTSNCEYKATGTAVVKVDDAQATLKAPVTKVSGSYLVCASSANLTVNDVVSEPNALISSATETVLCGEDMDPCPNSQVRPAGTRLATGGSTGFKLTNDSGARVLNCQDSMTFDSNQESGQPLPTTMGSAVNVASCLSRTNNGCSAAAWNAPASSIEGAGANKGVVGVGSSSQPLSLTATCLVGISQTCTWTATGTVNLNLDAGGNATAKAVPMTLTGGNSFWCGGSKVSLSIDRSYGGVDASPLYVALI